jgi:hypothetical protein
MGNEIRDVTISRVPGLARRLMVSRRKAFAQVLVSVNKIILLHFRPPSMADFNFFGCNLYSIKASMHPKLS